MVAQNITGKKTKRAMSAKIVVTARVCVPTLLCTAVSCPFRHSFADFNEEKFFSQRVVRSQQLRSDMGKLRQVMGMRDSCYLLGDVDEGFFSTQLKEEDKDQPLKRGRGSQKCWLWQRVRLWKTEKGGRVRLDTSRCL